MKDSHSLPLNDLHLHKLRATLNQTYTLIHILALTFIFFYRAAFFFKPNKYYHNIPTFPWLAVFTAELILYFLWFIRQPFYRRPVTRTVYPERLSKAEDELFPKIDVFICTTDPTREPTLEVMNTVISAICLDYPADKLSVYLSDDGGCSVSLMGLKECWVFATWWVPFCRKYNVKTICPMAFFDGKEVENHSKEFTEDLKIIKEKYEVFKERLWFNVQRGEVEDKSEMSARDHPAVVKVINANSTMDDAVPLNPKKGDMPLLVYVAREKRPSHSHNFKAGALNGLLRASSTLSNAPYTLVLDCDMYCNDPISARQAMCFFLDPKISPTLGWVQYPQVFHNANDTDVYSSQLRTVFHILWLGADGLQGPVISGTNFYIKREALYGVNNIDNGSNNLSDLKEIFGSSNELIKSVRQIHKPNAVNDRDFSPILLQEVEFLISCTYEKDTKWGEEIGFRYGSVVEDALTGLSLQNQGWRSVFLNPKRPQFLGSAITNLNDSMIQGIRWVVGVLEIGISKHSPLIISTNSKMQILHRISSSWITLFPLAFAPILVFAIIPPLCFLYAIPLYPKVSDPIFIAFGYIFIATLLKHMWEFINCGGSIKAWYNELVFENIKAVSYYVYGVVEFVITKLGFGQSSFIPTNKGEDEDKSKYYQMGEYDFRISNMFLVPIVSLVILNFTCFVVGLARVIVGRTCGSMFGQLFLSLYVLTLSYHVIKGMLLRKDKARVPISTSLTSMVVCFVIINFGYFVFYH